MEEASENEIEKKTLEKLLEIYEKNKTDASVNNFDENHLCFAPSLKYISEMIEESKDNPEESFKYLMIQTSIYYDQSKVLIAKNNIFKSLEMLKHSLSLIEEHKLNPHVTFLYFRITNQLACFLAKHEYLEDAKILLENAEQLYNSIETVSDILIYNTEDLFSNAYLIKQISKELKFEKLITNNFQIQGWIYNKLKMSSKFIMYQHIILNRLLETEDGSPLCWAFKCARLGSYFFVSGKFQESRYHLIAAYAVLKEYELDLLKYRTEPHFLREWTNLQKYFADLGKYWIKYGIFLFEASRKYFPIQPNTDICLTDLINSNKMSKMNSPGFENIMVHSFSSNYNLKTQDLPSPKDVTKTEEDVQFEGNFKDLNNSDEKNKMEEVVKKVGEDVVNSAEPSTENVEEEISVNKEEDVTPIKEEVEDVEKEVVVNKDEINENGELPEEENEKIEPEPVPEEEVLNKTESDAKDENNEENEMNEEERIANYKFIFPTLELKDFESKVPADLIKTTQQARVLFQYTQDWLQKTKESYTPQNAPLQYINLMLDLNELYRYLVKYELNLDEQYEVQKRRVNLLEAFIVILKELPPQFYLSLNVEILHELTQAQIELLALNVKKLHNIQGPSISTIFQNQNELSVRKIEALADIRNRLGSSDMEKTGPRLSALDLKQLGLSII